MTRLPDELERRIVHASGTVVPAIYLAGLLTYEQLQWLLIAGSLLAGALEIVRLWVGLDWPIFDRLTREYEQDSIAGYALYVFGGTIAALLFAPELAIPAMLMLTIADPVSGIASPGNTGRVKPIPVLALTFLTCVGVSLLAWAVALEGLTAEAVVLASLAATIADGVFWQYGDVVVDDNLGIPLGAAVAGWVGWELLPDVAIALPIG